ncbi:MAG: hypothetical protein AB7L09_00535 [Nitrospira sp.]
MIALELAEIVKEQGGLSVPLAPVVVIVEKSDGSQELVKLTGVVGETRVGGQWVFAFKAKDVATKMVMDLG